jgi:cation diffusion facilitator family transporter
MSMPSRRSIYAALVGNVAVGAVKLLAYFFSGSSSMLVESIHSGIDTLNQGLLLLGQRRGARPPDDRHPFGYGLEAYFWTFVVALLIFTVGGVASIYQGAQKLLHPTPLEHVPLTLAVLAICMVFEIASLAVSTRAAEDGRSGLSRKRVPKPSLAQLIHFSPDPGVFEVLAEDAASILGLLVAFFGVAGSAWLGWPWADGAAAVAIGLLLVTLAGVVVVETRSLLTGEAALPSTLDAAQLIFEEDPSVDTVCEVLSMQLGPDEILMAATLDFNDEMSTSQLEEATDNLTKKLKSADPRITRVFLRPGRALTQ